MITYILKSSLSLIVLFGLYWFLLRKEKLFVFNRFFLIFSILLAIVIPFISIPINIPGNDSQRNVITALNSNLNAIVVKQQTVYDISFLPITNARSVAELPALRFSFSKILILLYVSGVIFLMLRFLRNIYFITQQIRFSENVSYYGKRLVLTEDLINPYCFYNTIFVNKHDYLNKIIGKELLAHELEHLKQYHSIDILVLELIRIFYWFNPLLILFSRAIRVNHEYLADNGVLRDSPDIKSYAYNLLTFINWKRNIPLTSGFNHSLTKMRLQMITKSKSKSVIYGLRITLTLCMLIVFFLFISFRQARTQPIAPITDNSNVSDTLSTNKNFIISDTLKIKSSQTQNAMDREVIYTASGYIKQDTINKIVVLSDNASVVFGEISIKADSIVINLITNQLFATGKLNKSGDIIGRPNFKEDSMEFDADEVTYNLDSDKAIVKNVNARVNLKPKDSGSIVNSFSNKQMDKNVAGVVAVTNLNVLYAGIPNPIEIAVPGITSDRVTVTTTNGTITRSSKGWEINPLSMDDLVLNILVDKIKVDEKIFRVKPIPAPVAVFGRKANGSLSKNALATATLEAKLEDFLWDLKFEIESFTFAFSKDGFDNEITSKGNKLTDEMKSIISELKQGQSIIFKDIKAMGPDGKLYDLSPIILKVD
jgi:hypothetical protein